MFICTALAVIQLPHVLPGSHKSWAVWFWQVLISRACALAQLTWLGAPVRMRDLVSTCQNHAYCFQSLATLVIFSLLNVFLLCCVFETNKLEDILKQAVSICSPKPFKRLNVKQQVVVIEAVSLELDESL